MPQQELSREFTGQILQDITGDLATIHAIVQRMLTATGTGHLEIAPLEWRDLEHLRYAERQLDTKIKYLRGERY